jgi:hypothetical protein
LIQYVVVEQFQDEAKNFKTLKAGVGRIYFSF